MFILPTIAFISIIIIDYAYRRKILEAIADAWLAITIYTWTTVEILSVINKWNQWTVLLVWSAVCIILVGAIVQKKLWQKIVPMLQGKDGLIVKVRDYRGGIIAFGTFITLISITALMRSQSLVDNLTHRLPRIMHWIQNESVRYFATSSPRQVQLSSLTEYMNAQIYLLGGSDRLINLVQIGSYVCSGFVIFGISRKLGINHKLSFMAAGLYLLIPIGIIEVCTAQTDIVAGSYLIIFVYLLLDFIQADRLVMDKEGVFSAVRLSACVMAGYLTKPTVCFSMVIFFLWMCVERFLKKDNIIELFKYIIVGGSVAIILFSPSYIRNHKAYSITDNIADDIAQSESESIEGDNGAIEDCITEDNVNKNSIVVREANQTLVLNNLSSAKRFAMSCIQNLGMNASTRCFPQINKLITKVVYKCAAMLDYVFPPEGDFWIFVDNGELGETNEPSPAIMLFWVLAWGGIVLRLSKVSKEQLIYLFCATVSMILQSGLMGYTYYRARYLLGVMAVLCPVFAAVVQGIKANKTIKQKVVTTLIVISCFGVVNVFTYEIPYVVDGFKGEKIHQYFVNNNEPEYYYDQMAHFASKNGYTKIGIAGVIQYEYALWRTIENLERLEMVNVEDVILKKFEDASFVPECIFEESKEEMVIGDSLICHNVEYECVWVDFGNNRYYTVFIPKR